MLKLMFVVKFLFPAIYITTLKNGVPQLSCLPQLSGRRKIKPDVEVCGGFVPKKKKKSKQNPVWNSFWIIKINNFIKKEMNSYLIMFNCEIVVFFLKFMCLQ